MRCFLIFTFVLFPTHITAQNLKTDWSPWKKNELKVIKNKPDTVKSFKPSDIIIFTIKVYKETLSRQDGENCNFIPSCSSFAGEAIRKKGVVFGTLLAADRLTRCHYFSLYGNYRIYKNKLSDRVEDYVFK